MNNNIEPFQGSMMEYLEYLYANGYTLNEYGEVVPIENGMKLSLIQDDDEEEYE